MIWIRSQARPGATVTLSIVARISCPVLGELAEQGVKLYGVSCDSPWAQRAFKEKLGVSSEQLSDFVPKGAACAAFGVLNAGGFPERALVMIGPDGGRALEL